MKIKDSLTEKIIAACFKVHSELGPGFSEKVYHNAVKVALSVANLNYQTEKEFKIYYERKRVGSLRVDLIVEDKVIIEIKAITGHLPEVYRHQLLSYLKIADLHVGLMVNFGNSSCEIKRLSGQSV